MITRPNVASVAVFCGTAILLIKRAKPPFAGRWTLPGGRIEPGERAAETAARELHEETGLVVGELALVMQRDMQTNPPYCLAVFATRLSAGVPVPDEKEIADWQWAELEDIASLVTTDNLAEILAEAWDRLRATDGSGT